MAFKMVRTGFHIVWSALLLLLLLLLMLVFR